jgi:hypothetical protein
LATLVRVRNLHEVVQDIQHSVELRIVDLQMSIHGGESSASSWHGLCVSGQAIELLFRLLFVLGNKAFIHLTHTRELLVQLSDGCLLAL